MRECGTMRATVRQYTHTGRPLGSEEFVSKTWSFHSAGAGSQEGRQAHEARAGCQAGWLYLRCLDRMGNVPPALRFLNSRRKRREISMAKLSCSHMQVLLRPLPQSPVPPGAACSSSRESPSDQALPRTRLQAG